MFIVRPKYCEVIKCLHDRAADLETNTDTNAQLSHKNTWLCWIKFKNDRCKEGIKGKHKILKKKIINSTHDTRLHISLRHRC